MSEVLEKPKAPSKAEVKLAAERELAERVLAKRKFMPFVKRMNPRYKAGWVHADIAERLERFSEAVARGESPRLMILMPPRHGKSELASRMFPAWHLGNHPEHEFIATSYSLPLALSFSRKVQETMDDPAYQSVFDTRLNPNNRSAEAWNIEGEPGGYLAAGIGGGITGRGAHCLPAQVCVSTTEGSVPIEHLYQLSSKPLVLTPLGPRQILAMTRREDAHELYELRFASGRTLQVTGKHPIYLPDMGAYVNAEEIHGQAQSDGSVDLRVLREVVRAPALRRDEDAPQGSHGGVLHKGVQRGAPCGEEREAVCDMREAAAGRRGVPERDVLLGGVPPEPEGFEAQGMPGLQRGISAQVFADGVLRGGLLAYGARTPDDWSGELELQGRQFLQLVVRPGQGAGAGARQELRGVLDNEAPVLPPHRPHTSAQRRGEPGHAVPETPHDPSQVCYDTLSMVVRLGGEPQRVYDLQVEEAGCFFADQVLVGNCLVIDDPIKNAEEADSPDHREKIWEWYLSTAYSRLAPGGGVLVIQTWWHDDDLAGKMQQLMADALKEARENDEPVDEDVDFFEVVKYPAIAVDDEYLDEETHEIVNECPARGRLLRRRGEALHPQRYDLRKLNRIRRQNRKHDGADGRWWSALYQQNPVPDDGDYFTKDQFRVGVPPNMRNCVVLQAWDFAIEKKKYNDFTVGVTGYLDSDDVLWIVEIVRIKTNDTYKIVKEICDMAGRHDHASLTVGFEDGQIWKTMRPVLEKEMKERAAKRTGRYHPTEVLKPLTDKLVRARPLQGRMQAGKVCYAKGAPWYDAARAEMLRFPAGVHDDQVDAQAWLAQLAQMRVAPRRQAASVLKSWRDRLGDGVDSSGLSHMAS